MPGAVRVNYTNRQNFETYALLISTYFRAAVYLLYTQLSGVSFPIPAIIPFVL